MNIRAITIDDADALAKIHIDAWKEAYRDLVPIEHLNGLNYAHRAAGFRSAIADKREETYCAEDINGLLGFVTLGSCRDRDVDHSTTGEIWGIYLAPGHWRKGIGSKLCQYAESVLRSRHCHQIVLWVFEANASARRFYEALGFTIEGATKGLTIGGVALPTVRYIKKLHK